MQLCMSTPIEESGGVSSQSSLLCIHAIVHSANKLLTLVLVLLLLAVGVRLSYAYYA